MQPLETFICRYLKRTQPPEFKAKAAPGEIAALLWKVASEMAQNSLGGIQGAVQAEYNQDIIRFNLDVPGMNFSILEQRSTQFPVFLTLIQNLGLSDPLGKFAGQTRFSFDQGALAFPTDRQIAAGLFTLDVDLG